MYLLIIIDMVSNMDFVAYTKFADIEQYGDKYLIAKAPFRLPEGLREFFVNYGPYIMIAVMVLSLLGYYNLYSYTMLFSLWGYFWTPTMVVSVVISLIAIALQIKALPDMFVRKKEGWEYTVYASVIAVLPSIMSFQVIGGIISLIIGLYILFQIKYLYT